MVRLTTLGLMTTQKKLRCGECGLAVANTANVLARHVRSSHGIEWSDYVVKHEHGGVVPSCLCGCGAALSWRKGGFGKYLQGHDAAGIPLRIMGPTGPGWFVNPFTGREEHVSTDAEASLVSQCIRNGDRITRDHGLRIPWTDSIGAGRSFVPVLKRIDANVVIVIDACDDVEAGRRLAGCRSWCDATSNAMIILRPVGDAFDVIAAFNFMG